MRDDLISHLYVHTGVHTFRFGDSTCSVDDFYFWVRVTREACVGHEEWHMESHTIRRGQLRRVAGRACQMRGQVRRLAVKHKSEAARASVGDIEGQNP